MRSCGKGLNSLLSDKTNRTISKKIELSTCMRDLIALSCRVDYYLPQNHFIISKITIFILNKTFLASDVNKFLIILLNSRICQLTSHV